ncbi:MAG: glycosyltransferase family 4 protein [Verrucomicrobiota bacterium]
MTQKNNVLLTISGNIANNLLEDIAHGEKPRTDYIEMGKAFGADLIDYKTAAAQTGLIGKLLQKVAGNNMMLAWACFRQRKNYATIFTDGEQIGLPYALLLRLLGWISGQRPAHLMITHLISTRSKMMLTSMFGLQKYIDRFLVYSTRQQEIICQTWSLPKSRAPFTPFMVDQLFFSTEEAEDQPELPGITDTDIPYICSVGLEFRDYPTLMEAVEGLDIHIVIAAGSPWSKREDQTKSADIPQNVTVQRFTQKELRKLYHESQFVVMPLLENDFQAGITAILEAMALAKAIICTETRGQIDVIQEGKTGMYVPPHNPRALRDAIETLLNNSQLAEKMGQAGRQIIEDEMNLDQYTIRLNRFINDAKV